MLAMQDYRFTGSFVTISPSLMPQPLLILVLLPEMFSTSYPPVPSIPCKSIFITLQPEYPLLILFTSTSHLTSSQLKNTHCCHNTCVRTSCGLLAYWIITSGISRSLCYQQGKNCGPCSVCPSAVPCPLSPHIIGDELERSYDSLKFRKPWVLWVIVFLYP